MYIVRVDRTKFVKGPRSGDRGNYSCRRQNGQLLANIITGRVIGRNSRV